MDLRFTAAEQAFREEVRAFVDANFRLTSATRCWDTGASRKKTMCAGTASCTRTGWGAPSWPKEFGGTGWNTLQRLIFDDRNRAARARRVSCRSASAMIGPVLMKYASPELQARFLPRIPGVEDFWCQGYSEPGSGSDLASLRTRAVRRRPLHRERPEDLDHMAHFADWIFCLVRTDPEAQAAGRHLAAADRHEVARRHRAPDRDARRRP